MIQRFLNQPVRIKSIFNVLDFNKIQDRKKSYNLYLFQFTFCIILGGLLVPLALTAQENPPVKGKYTKEAAQSMITTSQGTLNPVYEPLAKQIVSDYNLAEKSSGIGIDLGSGPGNLIIELCKLTSIHWINADINPYFFSYFYAEADRNGFAHRVSAILADAQALPFRDNYADIIVSRGSYHAWENKELAFSEIFRVLKPGGVAYIGRGFARDMPVETARLIRNRQAGKPDYDPDTEIKELQEIFNKLKIRDVRIERPVPSGAEELNYGIWIEMRAPLDK